MTSRAGVVAVVLSLLAGGAVALWLLPLVGPAPGRWDKAAHFGFFALLASIHANIACRLFPGAARSLLAVHVISLGLAVGALDEWSQASIIGRSSSWLDFAADAVGIATGLVAFAALAWIRRRDDGAS